MHKELTAKGKATRNRIIEGAAAVLREKDVSIATLDDVMARTRTSKSQLFICGPRSIRGSGICGAPRPDRGGGGRAGHPRTDGGEWTCKSIFSSHSGMAPGRIRAVPARPTSPRSRSCPAGHRWCG